MSNEFRENLELITHNLKLILESVQIHLISWK